MNNTRKNILITIGLLLAITFFSSCKCDCEVIKNQTWVLEQYGTVSSMVDVIDPSAVQPPAKDEILLSFVDDRKFAGNDGCNLLFGVYEIEDCCQIGLDSFSMTLMLCSDTIMQQGGDYFTILEKVETFKIKNDRLDLITPDQEVLKYRKK